MSEDGKKNKTDWPAILFILVALPVAFTYGDFWIGVIVLIMGVIMLGWKNVTKDHFIQKRIVNQNDLNAKYLAYNF